MQNIKFYYCKKYDNLIEVTNMKNEDIVFEKEELTELIPNTVDAVTEKHVPKIEVKGNDVLINVGEVEHPMTEEHLIKAIYVVTEDGTVYRKYLLATDKPIFEIHNIASKHFDVYSYCNIHGLWKNSI